MPIDFSFLEETAPKQENTEPQKGSGVANVSIRVDADSMLQCDGEYIDIPLKGDVMIKTQLPIGQHLLEFISQENPNIKVEKVVDFPESDKSYLVIINNLKTFIAPPLPQTPQMQMPPQNSYLDSLNQMAQNNPLLGEVGIPQMPPMPK